MDLFLLKILRKTCLLGSGLDNPDLEIFLGSLLLRHIQNYPCNAHSIYEQIINDPKAANRSELTEIVVAAYPTLSLLNHSCDPNIL
jgi:SET and MYND domain-containing protein